MNLVAAAPGYPEDVTIGSGWGSARSGGVGNDAGAPVLVTVAPGDGGDQERIIDSCEADDTAMEANFVRSLYDIRAAMESGDMRACVSNPFHAEVAGTASPAVELGNPTMPETPPVFGSWPQAPI